jgi:acetate kinase
LSALSCEFIVLTLRAIDAREAQGRIIVAHLGNGASLTAVREGAACAQEHTHLAGDGCMLSEVTAHLAT